MQKLFHFDIGLPTTRSRYTLFSVRFKGGNDVKVTSQLYVRTDTSALLATSAHLRDKIDIQKRG